MKIEDIIIEPTPQKIDEKNWDIEKWREEYPVDYFKMAALLLRSKEPVVRSEVFKRLYQITRLYIPKIVYKYYSLGKDLKSDQEKLDTLHKGQVYMSEIKDFNDPFDGRGFYYINSQLANIERLKHCDGKMIEDFGSFIRVASFTDNGVQSMPMWAHYANNHKGFCVAYDTEDSIELKSLMFPVQYTDQRLDITAELKRQALIINDSIEATLRKKGKITILDDYTILYLSQILYNIKHLSWSYEREYRCMIAANYCGAPYISAKPKEIFIGINCLDKNASYLYDIADAHDINVYKMRFNEIQEKYELCFDNYKK